MSYGLIVNNDSNYIQIDSEKPRLCALYSGTYQATDSRLATIVFPSPITTVEPPCIFIQNSPERPDDIYTEMLITGSSGNWTGFTLNTLNVQNRPKGKWFASVFGSIGSASYGLRIWDDSSKIIYDSGAPPVIVTKASQTWQNPNRINMGSNAFAYVYNNTMVSDISSDEYFMINPFSRSALVSNVSYYIPAGVKYNWTEKRLQIYIVTNTQGLVWTDIGAYAGVFARLPGT